MEYSNLINFSTYMCQGCPWTPAWVFKWDFLGTTNLSLIFGRPKWRVDNRVICLWGMFISWFSSKIGSEWVQLGIGDMFTNFKPCYNIDIRLTKSFHDLIRTMGSKQGEFFRSLIHICINSFKIHLQLVSILIFFHPLQITLMSWFQLDFFLVFLYYVLHCNKTY
jgi:hypothetical protein